MTYQVAVCTHLRHETIARHTLRMLADGGVAPERVHLFVTPGQENDYRQAVDPGLYGHLHTGGVGLIGNRNAVTDAFPAGQRLVLLDDDLRSLVTLAGRKLRPMTALDDLFSAAFKTAEAVGASMWGVYPVPNAFYMKAEPSIGLYFCIGQVVGVINRPDERLSCGEKEDYERTLLRYERDGAVLRLDFIAAQAGAVRGNAGGLQDHDRRPANRAAVEYLLSRWPELVRVKGQRDDGYLEIALRQRGA